jgi:hypothetical protein
MSMFVQSNNGDKTENIFIRSLCVLGYILILIGGFIFPIFIFTLLIYHEGVLMIGILEFIFLVIPILFLTLARSKINRNFGIIIKLFIFGLFLFAIYLVVFFLKVLPAFLGAMG